jgi:hypothetical protein
MNPISVKEAGTRLDDLILLADYKDTARARQMWHGFPFPSLVGRLGVGPVNRAGCLTRRAADDKYAAADIHRYASWKVVSDQICRYNKYVIIGRGLEHRVLQ